jgi:hypothetical protein
MQIIIIDNKNEVVINRLIAAEVLLHNDLNFWGRNEDYWMIRLYFCIWNICSVSVELP